MDKRKAEDLLDNLQIPIGNLGYKFCLAGIEIYEQNVLISNKELYSKIADRYKTTPANVERNIRHSYENRKEEIKKFFKIDYKLNNRTLLALMVRELERTC